jgi:hypothetical protein
MTADRPLCVYALVAGRGLPPAFRAGGQRFRLVGRGTIAAVVGDRAKPPAPTSSNLRRYDRIMRELAARFPAMLPARFGTSIAEDEMLFIISSRRASLARALASVRGRVQMTIRVMTSDAEVPDPAPPAAGALTGRAYLTGKARAAAASRVVPAFEPIRRAVARWIRDERVDRRLGVASIYHLIPRASADAYRRTAQTAASDAGVRLVVSGPWPPYAFGAD